MPRNNIAAQARARGEKFYYTGEPCTKGHINPPRYSSCYRCLECCKEEMELLKRQTAQRKAERPLTPRQQAQRSGSLHYNTGKPCPRDHICDRLTSNGACLECVKETSAQRLSENAEVRDKALTYRKENAARYRVHVRNRRALLKVAGSHSVEDIDQLWTKQGGRCIYCKCRLEDGYHVDHRVPLSKGGSNSPDNIQLTCSTCNLKKHAKDHETFLKSIRVA